MSARTRAGRVTRAWAADLNRAQRPRAAQVLKLAEAIARVMSDYDPLSPRVTYRAVKRARQAAKRAGIPKTIWKRPLATLAQGTQAREAMQQTVGSLSRKVREHLMRSA